MSINIPDEILNSARMSKEELLQEIALLLFQKEKVTLGQAARLAGMKQMEFQHFLAGRKIPPHYDIAEFEEDMKTLRDPGLK